MLIVPSKLMFSLFLQYSTFFGDSLNGMRLQVDTLNKVIAEKDINKSRIIV